MMFVRYPVFIALTLCLAALLAMAGAGSARAQEPGGVDLGVYQSREAPDHGLYTLVVANYGDEDASGVRVKIEYGPDFYDYAILAGQLGGHPPSGGSLTIDADDPARLIWEITRLPARSRHHFPLLYILDYDIHSSDFDSVPFVVVATVSSDTVEAESKLENNRVEIWMEEHAVGSEDPLQPAPFRITATANSRDPQPGQEIIFQIAAFFPAGTTVGRVLSDTLVQVQLTPGLTYSGTHNTRKLDQFGAVVNEHDKSTYSHNQADNAGRWEIGPFTKGSFHLELTATLDADADVNEQCLTAEISGRPAEPLGENGVDPSLDNRVEFCLSPQPTLINEGDIRLFVLHDCMGETTYPCSSTNVASKQLVLGYTDPLLGFSPPANVVIQLRDDRLFRIASGNSVIWSTGYAETDDHGHLHIIKPGIRIYEDASLLDYDEWGTDVGGSFLGDYTVSLMTGPPRGSVEAAFFNYQDVRERIWFIDAATPWTAMNFYPGFDTLYFYEFSHLGTYKVSYGVSAAHAGMTHSDAETYTFHVGPIADLEALSARQTPEGLEVSVINNGPDPSQGARAVVGSQSCDFGGVFPPQDRLRVAGQPVTRTCVIPNVELTEAQLAGAVPIGTIENHVDYTVCIDPADASDVDAGTKAECEDPTDTDYQWHAGNVYDYDDSNNDIYLSQDPAPALNPRRAQPRNVTHLVVRWTRLAELYGSPVSYYQVERLDDAEWEHQANVPQPESGDPEYVDTDQDRAQQPRYRVRAVNTEGLAGPWNEAGGVGQPGVVLALDHTTIKEPEDPDNPTPDSTATVTATLTGPVSSQNVTVVVSAAPASGINPAEEGDYTLSENTTLTIPAGQRESTGVVTITAEADDDGENERVSITAVAAHARPNITPVFLTIDDDDDPGLTLGALSPAQVPEGGTAAYMVKLDAAPPENMDVTVRLTSNNSDVTVDTDTAGDGPQNTLTFTSDNWDTGQTVTVSAAQDADAADDTASITHQASGPFEYQSVRASLAVTVDDNDTAGVTVSDAGITVEEGKSGTYNVRLNTEPAGSVYITVTSDHPSVTVSPSRFSLGRSNWQTGRDVTVYVRNDNDAAVIAATLTHAVDAGATSADEYDGVTIASVSVSVTDDEAPTDYDGDNNGLLEITTAAQLNAIRYDLDGNGKPDAGATGNEAKDYARAFPRMMAGSCGNNFVAGTSEVGDPGNCTGYELAQDITLSGSWTPIGGNLHYEEFSNPLEYTATFDGNGHTISSLRISLSNRQYVGLFGAVGKGENAIIRNVGLANVNVSLGGESSESGALVGRNSGTITGAWVTGRVSGHAHIGGLVGFNAGTVERSYSAATVKGVDSRDSGGPLWAVRTAGLVGLNRGMVRNAYATGDVTGAGHVAGLVGWNDGSGEIINSYAAGKVTSARDFPTTGGLVGWQTATVTASYWDTEATGQKEGAGQGNVPENTGKTTAELQNPESASGIYANWDANVWNFRTGSDYPCLGGVGECKKQSTGQTAPNRGSDSVGYALARGGAAWAVTAPLSYVYDWGMAESLTLRDLWRRPRRSGRRAGRR